MKQAIVIALGGSLLSNKTGEELTSWRLKIVELVISLNDEGKKVIIIIGGGELARKKIKDAIDLGLTGDWNKLSLNKNKNNSKIKKNKK